MSRGIRTEYLWAERKETNGPINLEPMERVEPSPSTWRTSPYFSIDPDFLGYTRGLDMNGNVLLSASSVDVHRQTVFVIEGIAFRGSVVCLPPGKEVIIINESQPSELGWPELDVRPFRLPAVKISNTSEESADES